MKWRTESRKELSGLKATVCLANLTPISRKSVWCLLLRKRTKLLLGVDFLLLETKLCALENPHIDLGSSSCSDQQTSVLAKVSLSSSHTLKTSQDLSIKIQVTWIIPQERLISILAIIMCKLKMISTSLKWRVLFQGRRISRESLKALILSTAALSKPTRMLLILWVRGRSAQPLLKRLIPNFKEVRIEEVLDLLGRSPFFRSMVRLCCQTWWSSIPIRRSSKLNPKAESKSWCKQIYRDRGSLICTIKWWANTAWPRINSTAKLPHL